MEEEQVDEIVPDFGDDAARIRARASSAGNHVDQRKEGFKFCANIQCRPAGLNKALAMTLSEATQQPVGLHPDRRWSGHTGDSLKA
jgi:hypothetical protein